MTGSEDTKSNWEIALARGGLLYLPFLLIFMFFPVTGDLIAGFFSAARELPTFVAFVLDGSFLFLLLFVCVFLANGYLEITEPRKGAFRAGSTFATYAFIYIVGNLIGVEGGVWYFLHLNMLLMLALTDGVNTSLNRDKWNSWVVLYIGHRLVGLIFGLALISFTRRPVWVLLDFFAGTYLALSASITLAYSLRVASTKQSGSA
jgi:hypothetical protein